MPGLRRNVSSRRRTPAGLNGHRGASFWVNMLRPVALRLACGLTLAASWLASAPLAAKPPPKRAEAVQPPPPSAEESACFDHHELGQELRQAGKLVESRAAFLECAASDCPTAVQRDCERWSREVAAELPKLELEVRFAGKPRNDASVEIDGEPRADALASAVVLAPGLHRYRVRLAGARGVEGALTLRAGEPTHQLSLELEPLEEGSRRVPTLSWVLGGVGVLGAGSFLYFGLSSRSLEHELERSCAPLCTNEQIDRVRQRSLIANVSLGVGLASLASGAALYLLSDPEQAPPEQPVVQLGVVPLAGGALGNVQLRAF